MRAATLRHALPNDPRATTPPSTDYSRCRGVSPEATGETDEVRVAIYVRANSISTSVGGVFDDSLVVRVGEVQEKGRATDAALAALAAALGVSRRAVSLVRGATSRRKLVEVETDQPSVIAARIMNLRAVDGESR